MNVHMFRLICLLACLVIAAPAFPQGGLQDGQGHPLKGVWLGEWGPNRTSRNDVTIEMNWDGKAVTGSINPGPEAIPFSKAELNHNNWTVHLEAEKNGVRYVIDGRIENLGSVRRAIVGTWVQGNQRGDFRIQRH
jgi:hypothetical protein